MPRPFRAAAQTARWLGSDPPLSELRARQPNGWKEAARELERAAADGPEGLQRLVTERATRPQPAPDRLPNESARIHALVRDAMSPGDRSLSGAEFEIAFMEMMIKHHEAAIREGERCLDRAYHAELRSLCEDIIETQSAEIAQMQTWLCEWYGICKER